MNERIKELAVEARNYALDEKRIYERVHNTEQCMEEYRDVYNKKFAELIVQECMTMCDNVSADYFKHRKAADDFQDKNIYAEGESACDEVRYEIKKHFGVEE
jgi:hypothetical protein